MNKTSQRYLDAYAISQKTVVDAKNARSDALARLPGQLRARMKANKVERWMLVRRLEWSQSKMGNFLNLGQPLAPADLEKLFSAVEIKPTADEKSKARRP
jgi:hypothetical protein